MGGPPAARIGLWRVPGTEAGRTFILAERASAPTTACYTRFWSRMNPIRDISALQPGDILYHAYLGFAVVEDVDEGAAGLTVSWEDPDADASPRVPAVTLVEEFCLCSPGGFLSRSITDPGRLSDLVTLEPARALAQLLDDFDGPMDVDAVRRWIVGRELLPEADFDAWWKDAKRAVGGDPRFQWQGGRLAMARPTGESPSMPAAFLAAGARRRMEMLDQMSSSERNKAVEGAIEAGDIDAVVVLLRGRAALPHSLLGLLRGLVRGGESRVAAALLGRNHPEVMDDFALLLAEDQGRVLVREALVRLPRGRRQRAVEALRERANRSTFAEAAHRFLDTVTGDLATGDLARREGATVDAMLHEPVTVEQVDDDDSSDSLRFPGGDTTVGIPAETPSTLLTQLSPLPAHRMLPLSLAVARALAARHTSGDAGGLLGARLRAGGAVDLGAPEDSTPRRDVRDAIRLICELAIGRLPPGARVDDEQLLGHIQLLVPGLSLDWMAVAGRALAVDESLRPADGLSLWAMLERAAANERVRTNAPRNRSPRLQIAHDTHIGLLKSRLGQVNQDAVFWYAEGAHGLIVVADGISISTAGSGDLASSILVRVVVALWEQHHERLRNASTEDLRGFVDSALAMANQAICNASVRMAGGDLGQHIPMGTTALLGLVQGSTVQLGALGDSRAYLVTSNGVALITGDQNLRGEWLGSWQRGRPVDLAGDGNALTGYCGHFNERVVAEAVPPAQRTVTLLPGETLLLCSDGFTDYSADTNAEVHELIEEAVAMDDLGEACRFLTASANARGGGDNITVLMVRMPG